MKPIIDALGLGPSVDNVTGLLGDLTSGIGDGLNLLGGVQQAIGNAYQNGDVIPPVNPNERPTIAEGALGSQSNPIQNNLSSNTVNYFSNSLNNYDASVDTDLRNYINTTITTVSPIDQGGNFGAKGTHNTVTGEPYVDSSGNVHIPDTYGFGPSSDIYNKPVVKQVSDFTETIVNALGGDGKGASENVQTFFDQAGVGAVLGAPGKDAPIVHFETVIPASKIPNANFNKSAVKESRLFERFKRKQEDTKKNIGGFQALIKTLESLPKPIKKVLLFQIKAQLEIAFLPPDQKAYREKEIKNQLINKYHDVYVDTHFPENKQQTSRVKKILARNIKLSDPKTFKDPKPVLTYGKLFGGESKSKKVDVEDPNRKSIARFLKKPKQKTKEQLRMEKLEELDRLEKTLLS